MAAGQPGGQQFGRATQNVSSTSTPSMTVPPVDGLTNEQSACGDFVEAEIRAPALATCPMDSVGGESGVTGRGHSSK